MYRFLYLFSSFQCFKFFTLRFSLKISLTFLLIFVQNFIPSFSFSNCWPQELLKQGFLTHFKGFYAKIPRSAKSEEASSD